MPARTHSGLDFLAIDRDVVDATGGIVAPGFIDPHQHLLGRSGERGLCLETPMIFREEERAGVRHRGEEHWRTVRELLLGTGAAGSLTTDARRSYSQSGRGRRESTACDVAGMFSVLASRPLQCYCRSRAAWRRC